jgi:predicted dehydrogenase
MTARLQGAFIGFGNIAEKGHWPTYAQSPDTEIVAIMEPSPTRQEAAKALKPDLRVYATAADLFAKEKLDFVDICTPPASHASLALQALDHNCHVLCEKPLSLKTEDYLKLAKSMAQHGRTVFTVHNWKYAPIYQKVFSLIQEGRIGQVWHVEIFTLRNQVCKGTAQGVASPPTPLPMGEGGADAKRRATGEAPEDWRTDPSIAGGGILVDHGWHAFYLLLNLVKAEPQRILAKMLLDKENPTGLEEAVQTLVQFPEADGYIHLTWKSAMRKNSAIVQGLEGTILLDDDRILLTTRDGKQEEIKFESALSAGSHHADWFQSLLPAFVEEIRDPSKRGTNFREAGWCLALTSSAYASALQGFKETEVLFPGTPSQQPALA